jgi:hypothetical protein
MRGTEDRTICWELFLCLVGKVVCTHQQEREIVMKLWGGKKNEEAKPNVRRNRGEKRNFIS